LYIVSLDLNAQNKAMQPKLFAVLLLIFTCMNADAQFQKGMYMVGASIGTGVFSSGATDYSGPGQISSTVRNTNVNVQLSPSIGKFVSNQAAVGASLLLNLSNQTFKRSVAGTTDKKDHSNNVDFGIGGFMRYYFTGMKTVKPFTHIYVNGGSGTTKTDGLLYVNGFSGTDRISYEGRSSGRFFYNAGINLGITKMLNPNTGLDLYAGYGLSHTQFTIKTTQTYDYGNPSFPDTQAEFESSQKFTGHALNIGIGFQVFLNRK
jgi:hypothetical protein